MYLRGELDLCFMQNSAVDLEQVTRLPADHRWKRFHVRQLLSMPRTQLQRGRWNKHHMNMHLPANHIKLNRLVASSTSVSQHSWESATACI